MKYQSELRALATTSTRKISHRISEYDLIGSFTYFSVQGVNKINPLQICQTFTDFAYGGFIRQSLMNIETRRLMHIIENL